MYIGGTLISSVEFHGNMSLVIFMSKCPLACRYCHNVELLEDNTEWSFEKVMTLEQMEKKLMKSAIKRNRGNISLAAEELGITRQTLYNKGKKYKLFD